MVANIKIFTIQWFKKHLFQPLAGKISFLKSKAERWDIRNPGGYKKQSILQKDQGINFKKKERLVRNGQENIDPHTYGFKRTDSKAAPQTAEHLDLKSIG